MEGPDPHIYLPPMILPGNAGPVNALGYCEMLASSQASLVERPSQRQRHNHPPLVRLRLGDQANRTSVK